MKTNNCRKMWSQPAITSVERMKDAAGGTNTNIAKSADLTEYLYGGPGS